MAMQIMNVQQFVSVMCAKLSLPAHRVLINPQLARVGQVGINACVSSLLPNTIQVTSGFVEELTLGEQCAIMSHELAHVYHKHTNAKLAVDAVGFAVGLAIWFLPMSFLHKVLAQLGFAVAFTAGEAVMIRRFELEADQMSRKCKLNHELQSALRKVYASMHVSPAIKMMLAVTGCQLSLDRRINALN